MTLWTPMITGVATYSRAWNGVPSNNRSNLQLLEFSKHQPLQYWDGYLAWVRGIGPGWKTTHYEFSRPGSTCTWGHADPYHPKSLCWNDMCMFWRDFSAILSGKTQVVIDTVWTYWFHTEFLKGELSQRKESGVRITDHSTNSMYRLH